MEPHDQLKASVNRQRIAFFVLLLFIGFLTYLVINLSQRVSSQEALNSTTEAGYTSGGIRMGGTSQIRLNPGNGDFRLNPGRNIQVVTSPEPSQGLQPIDAGNISLPAGKCGDICQIGSDPMLKCGNGEVCSGTGVNLFSSGSRSTGMIYTCHLPQGGCAPLKENETCYSDGMGGPNGSRGTCETGTSCRCFGVGAGALGVCSKDASQGVACPTN